MAVWRSRVDNGKGAQGRIREFALGGHHLIATWKSTNRSKRDKDPSEWLPPNRAYWCTYLGNWVAIKRTRGLSMDADEADAIREGLRVCGRYVRRDALLGRH